MALEAVVTIPSATDRQAESESATSSEQRPKQADSEVPAGTVASILRALRDRGGVALVESIAADSGPVSVLTVDRLLDTAATELGDPELGIRLATSIPVGALGAVDYAFCASATLRDAVERLSRHWHLISGRGSVVLVEESERASLVFGERAVDALARHWTGLVVALVAERIRHALGDDATLLEVSFRHEAPRNAVVHEQFFGARVVFGQSEDAICFPLSLLDTPFRTAAAAIATLLDEKLTEVEPSSELVHRVRCAVVELLRDKAFGVQLVATKLHMSARTLQRELRKRGTSHSAIVDAVRRARALDLLDAQMMPTQVAHHIGFSEPGAFFRAFRRWTGKSPGAFRMARLVRDPSGPTLLPPCVRGVVRSADPALG